MWSLLENVEFWKALSAMLWPIVALIVFLSARSRIYSFLNRENLSIKVAGMELSVADATKNIGSAVSDLQKRLGELETKLSQRSQEGGNQAGAPITPVSQEEQADVDDRPFSILWVDDNPPNNAFLVEQFESEGTFVKLALSTEEALVGLSSDDFQLIITDLGRTERGVNNSFAGLDLIKRVRTLNPSIPIMVYAGSRGMKSRSRLLQAGANFVTQSPVEVQSFVKNVRSKTR